MNSLRIPDAWRHMQPGDFIHTRMPRRRLDRYVDALKRDGYAFALEKSPTGHFVNCRRAPSTEGSKQ